MYVYVACVLEFCGSAVVCHNQGASWISLSYLKYISNRWYITVTYLGICFPVGGGDGYTRNYFCVVGGFNKFS